MKNCVAAYLAFVLFSSAAVAQTTAALNEPAEVPGPRSQQQVERALQIAKLAAQNGMETLSLRAAREALSGGPPIQAVPATPNLRVFNPASAVMNPVPVVPQASSVMVRQNISDLDVLWKEQKFDAKAVYQTIEAIVFPIGRPDEVFFYEEKIAASAMAGATSTQPISLATFLIDWAERADAVDTLRLKLDTMKSGQRSRIPATVIQAMLELRKGDNAKLKEHLRQVKTYLTEMSTGTDAEIAAQLAFPLVNAPDVSAEAAAIVEGVLDTLVAGAATNRSYHVEPATTILKAVTTAYRNAGNLPKVKESVARLLKVNSVYNNRYNNSSAEYVARLRQAQINTAINLYVDAGLLKDAVPLMAEYAELKAVTGRSYSQGSGGKLFRSLGSLEPAEAYEILRKILFPGGAIETATFNSSFVPRSTPPKVFFADRSGDSLSNTGRSDALDRLRLGIFQDVSHTGALLVRTAKEAGLLNELTAELLPIAKSPAEGVDVLIFFALRESLSPDIQLLTSILDNRAKSLVQLSSSQSVRNRLSGLEDYVLAVSAAETPALLEPALRLLKVVEQKSKDTQAADVRTHTRRAIEYLNVVKADADPGLLQHHNLQHWHIADCDSVSTHASGTISSSWVTSDGYLQNLGAPQDGLLYFRYPLTGQFQVSAIVTEGNWTEGGFVYDGILMESHAYDQSLLKLHVARPQHNPSQVNLAVGGANPTHLDLRIEGGKSLFRINRHVANTDTLSGASPFFAVKASGGWTPGFRDLKITGNPEIPRKVELLQDHRLRGWTSYYNENLTSAFVEEPADKTYDWQLQDGVLNAKSNPDMGSAESLLTYLRPMLSGEKISWEFRYLPGIENCHPALGQLAFLLKPDGVQLHWITDGDLEWSLLTADNAVVESASQRGGKLPLLENDWNKAELKLAGRRVQLVLNGELVMEREHELSLQTQFGLFRNRLSESVSARNIELTGDWPKSFAEASAGGLLALETSERSVQDRHAIAEAIGEQQYNLMGYQVSRDSELLPPKERLDVLKRWVLPGDDKLYVRDQGGFVPSYLYNDTSVAGSHADYVVNKAAGNQAKTAWHRQPGGLVSPALDLVFAAAELGELDQLKLEVVKISNDYRQSQNVRSCNAILSAIATAEGDFATANALIDGIYERVKVSTQTTVRLRWSALVAAWNAIQFPETIDGGLRILDHMVDQQFNRGMSTGWEFDHPIRAMRGLARSRWAIAAGLERLLPEDGDWIPVTRVRAQTSALGIGAPHWTQNLYGGATHHSGHEEDFLYYAVPLTGDFTVECEMTSFGWREVRFMYDDHWVGISSDRNKFDHGRSWQTLPSSIFTKTPLDIGDWFQFQLKVENGICSHWVNGTKIFQEQLSEHPDPWLAIRCGANIEGGSIRNLKISGSPTVPDQLELLKQDRLNGWTASHFRQSSSDWKRVSNEIVGVRHPETAYQSRESLLQYHRPLLEDGIIEYDFLYDSEFPDNQRGVHPAIGRLAFVLGTDRVSEHVISNGIYGHDGIDPDNTQVFENYHLSKGPLPLKPGVNHMKVTVKGNELLLNLNDTDIYRRHLSTSDQRFFGFFHYNGVTEARIRNVTYRGAWAREVPSVSKQQFAGVSESFDLRVDSDDASKSIAYSFETDGLTDLLFDSSSNPRNDSVFLVDGAGVHVDYSGGPGWNSKTLSPHLAIEGDFDVTVKFSDLAIKTPDTDKSSGIHLGLTFMSSTKDTVEVMRRMRGNGEHVVESMWVVNAHDGTKYLSTSQPEASSEGRFRLSRRGDVVLWMYAANNDSQFRVVRTERVSDAAVVLESIDFECQVGGAGGVSATWKGFDIRAENLLRSNPSSAR